MHTPAYTLNTLFAQLGLDSSDEAITAFLQDKGPIPADMPLAEAPFWNDAQRKLLVEAVAVDSDWSEVVDQLDVRLRE